MKIEEVLVVGAGTMGRQVAQQCAMFGYRTTLYDPDREALNWGRILIERSLGELAGSYVAEPGAAIARRLYYSNDLAEAAAAADLVSESAPEDLPLKRALFAELGAVAPAHAIFTTNSSGLVPSLMAEATGRPDRFLALHFHKTVWVANVVDVMPHPGTDPALVQVVAGFARSIRQIPIVLAQERWGYVFNAMQWAYLSQALELWFSGAAHFEDIDRAWMIAERAAHGPFGAMDFVGLDTIHHVLLRWSEVMGDATAAACAEKLKAGFVDCGLLGVKSGRGFYGYPEPAYQDPTFIRAAEPAAASAAS